MKKHIRHDTANLKRLGVINRVSEVIPSAICTTTQKLRSHMTGCAAD